MTTTPLIYPRTRKQIGRRVTPKAGAKGTSIRIQGETLRTDVKGDAVDWAFGVPSVFLRSAMGFKEVEGEASRGKQAHVWNRNPPVLRTFKLGDMFYEPPAARHLVWEDALRILRRSAQVVSATSDHAGAQRGSIEPGQVEFTVTDYVDGAPRRSTKRRATQQQFEEFLRTGRLP